MFFFFFIIPTYVCVAYRYMGQSHARCFMPGTIILLARPGYSDTQRSVGVNMHRVYRPPSTRGWGLTHLCLSCGVKKTKQAAEVHSLM